MRTVFFCLLVAGFSFFFGRTEVKNDFSLRVSYPNDSEILELTGRPFFLFGMLSPAGGEMKVNGVKADTDEDGAFLVYAPVIILDEKTADGFSKGKFVFHIYADGREKTFEQYYKLKFPPATSEANKLEPDPGWRFEPSENIALMQGEALNVEFKSAPGCSAFFNIEGIKQNFPMPETFTVNSFYWADAIFGAGFTSRGDTIKGIYKGHAFITQKLKDAKVTVTISHPELGHEKFTAAGTLSTLDNQVHHIVSTSYDPNLITARFQPAGGYKLFLPEGIRLEVTGQHGNWLKTRLSGSESAYLPAASVYQLPAGSALPRSNVQLIRTKDFERYSEVQLGFSERLPFDVKQLSDPQRIELTVYNVFSDIDWVFLDRKSSFIKEITHTQPEDGVLKVVISLDQKTHWGYKPVYDGNILKLRINKPPKKNIAFLFWNNQLKGRSISIDPGHTSDLGAVGPRGTKEKDVNYEIALELQEMLSDAGARVQLTHWRNVNLELRDRKARVNAFNPEISISIHNNSVPQGVDPLRHTGSSVYYYFPQALPLAKLVHKNLLAATGLPDFGLYWDNLYMSRIPESISLLVEPAFMIVPQQEKSLLDADFRHKIAKSLYDAIDSFYKEYAQ